MFSLSSSHRFQLYRYPTDMRKSFDGLCGIVISDMQAQPYNGEVYIFVNKTRDRMKLLHWEPGGFTLYYKRLEQGTFEMPSFGAQSRHLTWTELAMIVSGIGIKNIVHRKRYESSKLCG